MKWHFDHELGDILHDLEKLVEDGHFSGDGTWRQSNTL